MSAQPFLSRPSLEFYKKQATDLVNAFRTNEPTATERFRQHHPRFARHAASSPTKELIALSDAQLVIAREHGFASWPLFA